MKPIMRFLHTADWHLGKTLCNASLLEDQALALEELLAMAKDTKAQALVVAGDLYDRAVPPKEAVALLDGFLTRIIRDLKVAVLVIAGNHDGPERLAFGRSFLGEGGLHVAGLAEAEPEPVVIGDCAFHLLPYADPTAARFALDDPELRSHQDVVAAQLARAWACHPSNRRMVAVAHAFVRGGLGSESELGLAVGGTGEVDADLFEPCDYAALGHLHAPQQAGHSHVRYAGSLLKYSASEAGHVKAATLVELGERGPARTEPLPFSPRRDLRRVRGRFEDFLKGLPGNREDYLFLELTDEGPVLDAMARLRPLYPNVLGLSTAESLPADPGPEVERADPRRLDPEALFARFAQEVSGQELSEEEWAVFREVAGSAFTEGREP
jgi:DNA repair protein SbcD/Mre11